MEERGLGESSGVGGWDGIKHLSDASLMARRSDFRTPVPFFLPLVLRTARAITHTTLSLSICPFSYTFSPYLSIVSPLSHLHNLGCHAFVPLCLSLFCLFCHFCAYLLFTSTFDGVEGKDDALSLHHLLKSASEKKGRERDKVKRRVAR